MKEARNSWGKKESIMRALNRFSNISWFSGGGMGGIGGWATLVRIYNYSPMGSTPSHVYGPDAVNTSQVTFFLTLSYFIWRRKERKAEERGKLATVRLHSL